MSNACTFFFCFHAFGQNQQVFFLYGRGDFGRLGHGNSSDLFTPQPIKALHGIRIKQIACGDSHCLAVTMGGEVQRLVVLLLSSSFGGSNKPYAHLFSLYFDKDFMFVFVFLIVLLLHISNRH